MCTASMMRQRRACPALARGRARPETASGLRKGRLAGHRRPYGGGNRAPSARQGCVEAAVVNVLTFVSGCGGLAVEYDGGCWPRFRCASMFGLATGPLRVRSFPCRARLGTVDGPGVPRIALQMNENLGVSVLRLGYEIERNSPDWPTVTISIDGVNPFAEVAPEWGGFDPQDVLIEDSPLLPQHPPRRVGVWRCSCGIEGCGVIAPVIAATADGEWVTWSDPCDYTGVFVGPYPVGPDPANGRPWPLPTYRFAMSQYVAEVRRATADRSWESPRRATARLLTERLRGSELPAGLSFQRASPWKDGYAVSYQRNSTDPDQSRQVVLLMTSDETDSALAAQDMADRLLATPPEERDSRYGWRR